MYREYFGFEYKPFSIAPDPRFLFMSPRHREALAHLLYGIGEGGGFVQLTGEVGTGKTTVCRCLLEQLPDNVDVALILNPKLSATELVASICDELRIPYPGESASLKALIDPLNRHLLATHAKGRRTVLMIDEAQNLSTEVLEQVRLLTNLETTEEKLLQIILIGQPELNEVLGLHNMRQLAQRVTARYHLKALNREECEAYIEHRLHICGVNQRLFNKRALDEIQRLSGGIPRLINVLCDRALLGAYVENKRTVDRKVLRRAAKEVGVPRQNREDSTPRANWLPWVAGITAAVALAWFAVGLWPDSEGENVQAAVELKAPEKVEDLVVAKALSSDPVIEKKMQEPELAQEEPIITTVPASNTLSSPVILGGFTADSDSVTVATAASNLYREWGVEDAGKRPICDSAKSHGLTCLKGKATWDQLNKLDRPAILKLNIPGAGPAYVVLKTLSGGDATLVSGQESLLLPVTDVKPYWRGEFQLLWRSPIQGRSLKPGERGKDIGWLRRQMGAVLGGAAASADPLVFDEPLRQQVRQFQAIRGLEQDGVVGRHTLIHINSLTLGSQVPRLAEKTT